MKVAVDRTTFAAGEVSPELYARTDLARHATAVASCENFVVLLEGGVTRRPGTQFISPVRTESEAAKFMRFAFGAGDSYMLVFNGGKIRFVRDGGVIETSPGVPYEINQPYLAADLAYLRYAQVGNLVFIACRPPGSLGYAPKVLQRFAHTNWTLIDYAYIRGPMTTMNTDKVKQLRASGFTVGASINLEADNRPWTAADVGKIIRLDEDNYETVPQWVANESIAAIGDQRRWDGNIYQATGLTFPANSGTNPPVHLEGTVVDGTVAATTPTARAGWTYLHSGYGYVKITAVINATNATATVMTRLPNSVVGSLSADYTYRWWESAWGPGVGWPETVRLHQGRLVWTLDDFFWMTKPSDFFDFEITLYPDSALSGRLTSPDGQKVDVRWQLAAGVLLFGTATMEWSIRGQSSFDSITIEGIRPIDEDTNGSTHHDPARVDEGVVFIGKSKDRLHYGRFDKIGEAVSFEELSVTARHILVGDAAVLAYQRDPMRLVWVALATGELRCITLMPKQEMRGWHRHPLVNGFVEDIACIPHNTERYDELHLIVRRVINGATRRYIEILRPFFEPASLTAPTALGAWFVDCGLSYAGAPISTITNLQHLAGETVRVFCDGAQRPDGVVSLAGQLVISPASGDILVGLPINARLRSLDIEGEGQAGTTKGRQKESRFILVQRTKSVGGTLASNGGTPEDIDDTGTLYYGAPLPLSARPVPVTLESASDLTVVLELVCANALPFTLLGWTPDLEVSEAA